jgi:molecular chaperone GrpE
MDEEYLNNWKRTQADFENYKKDERRRMDEFAKFATENLVQEILDIVGNLERAAKHIEDEGLKSILKQFDQLLSKYGVERIAVVGQKFDPAVHEAVEALDERKDLVEVQAGYTMHGKVIRPARVSTSQSTN